MKMDKVLMAAARAAIAEVGISGLKRTSLFLSNERQIADQVKAAA